MKNESAEPIKSAQSAQTSAAPDPLWELDCLDLIEKIKQGIVPTLEDFAKLNRLGIAAESYLEKELLAFIRNGQFPPMPPICYLANRPTFCANLRAYLAATEAQSIAYAAYRAAELQPSGAICLPEAALTGLGIGEDGSSGVPGESAGSPVIGTAEATATTSTRTTSKAEISKRVSKDAFDFLTGGMFFPAGLVTTSDRTEYNAARRRLCERMQAFVTFANRDEAQLVRDGAILETPASAPVVSSDIDLFPRVERSKGKRKAGRVIKMKVCVNGS